MIEPKVKDDVIRLLYERKGTAEIATALGIEQNYVVAAIREIQNRFPGGFSEYKPYGDNMIGISLHPKYAEEMFIFVKTGGGFLAEHEKYQDSVKKENYKSELEISNLELAVRAAQEAELNADKAEKRAKRAELYAGGAVIVAIVVFLFEIYKFIIAK
ncbi:hypothetical protein FHW36_11819 [Chitinophaga polysaccharea]|uniref:Uncharacterized protein n=1 Tax=Chitinophaga polysaccharea TaxID=1293035 RepID=A0A561P0Y0_9BACT|nr:hypothetical protein [Chitinophaga polysaccharea]TWF31725.1 hypothetical protein FHW36_11819 [Chitinophaga polysaccharea]